MRIFERLRGRSRERNGIERKLVDTVVTDLLRRIDDAPRNGLGRSRFDMPRAVAECGKTIVDGRTVRTASIGSARRRICPHQMSPSVISTPL
jgi:hypothetical protein